MKGDHCKFADDGTLWHTGHSIEDLIKLVSSDIMQLSNWCYKWKMTISLPKTEVTLFTPRKISPDPIEIKINQHTLKYNKTPKILGITLDEHLNYKAHIHNTARKAADP